MTLLTEIAYAKINLALHVRNRRHDSYHEIETLFAFCADGDLLSVEEADGLELTISGPFSATLSTGPDNLVLRAAHALRKASTIASGAAIHLEKRLPIAAGIGGGSADAAAALHLLTRFWDLPDDLTQLMDIARPLGADVPACLVSQTMRGEGVGDQLELIDAGPLADMPVLLVNPNVACPTGPVFAGWNGADDGPLIGDTPLAITLGSHNGLEASATALVGDIAAVLLTLRKCEGLILARMSGSGATCFALFETEDARDAATSAMPSTWWTLATKLR